MNAVTVTAPVIATVANVAKISAAIPKAAHVNGTATGAHCQARCQLSARRAAANCAGECIRQKNRAKPATGGRKIMPVNAEPVATAWRQYPSCHSAMIATLAMASDTGATRTATAARSPDAASPASSVNKASSASRCSNTGAVSSAVEVPCARNDGNRFVQSSAKWTIDSPKKMTRAGAGATDQTANIAAAQPRYSAVTPSMR